MSGVLKIEVRESSSELKELLRRQKNQVAKERIQVLYWIKTKQAESVNHLAVLIGRHRTTVSRWLGQYRCHGLAALINIPKSSGRASAIASSMVKRIQEELKDPEGFQSYGEIQRWLEAVHDVKVSYTVVYKLVRYRLKAKLKVPRPVHIKQEKGAVESFKKNCQNC